MKLQKLYSYTRQAINDFQMIQDGDKIAIGVSGGKDSLALLYALSGLQKSIRGSDVNASLHYLAKLLKSEDLVSITRRLSIIAYEDIGLANPTIGPRVKAAVDAARELGNPEARLPLSVIVIEMALSPKSNSAELAIDKALQIVYNTNSGNVPSHIKNGNPNYKYPHNYPKYYVKQQYLPDKIKNKKYHIVFSGSLRWDI